VTRDYNQYRDFSHAFADVVRFFDGHP